MDSRLTLLEELRTTLENLLSIFENQNRAEALVRAREECDQAFERFRREHEAQGEASADLPPPVRAAMEDVQRLYAVAQSMSGREREATEQDLDKLGRARKVLRTVRSEGETKGGYCNRAG